MKNIVLLLLVSVCGMVLSGCNNEIRYLYKTEVVNLDDLEDDEEEAYLDSMLNTKILITVGSVDEAEAKSVEYDTLLVRNMRKALDKYPDLDDDPNYGVEIVESGAKFGTRYKYFYELGNH